MYSVIGVLALIVLLIVNQDVIFKAKENEQIPSLKYYRLSLLGVGIYYISDFMWGIFEEFNLTTLYNSGTIVILFPFSGSTGCPFIKEINVVGVFLVAK